MTTLSADSLSLPAAAAVLASAVSGIGSFVVLLFVSGLGFVFTGAFSTFFTAAFTAGFSFFPVFAFFFSSVVPFVPDFFAASSGAAPMPGFC